MASTCPERDHGPGLTLSCVAEPTVVSYDWHVRLKRAAPDCFSKEIITVNGEFQPTITVRQGNILQVSVRSSSSCPCAKPAPALASSAHALCRSLTTTAAAA